MPKQITTPAEMLAASPVAFHILVALSDQDRHGYDIMKTIEDDTDGRLQINLGSLYGAIKRLRAAKLIDVSTRERPKDDDARRRYYQLTPLGKELCVAEIKRREQELMMIRTKADKLLSSLGCPPAC